MGEMRPLCLDPGVHMGFAYYNGEETYDCVYFDQESRPAKLDFFTKWLTWAIKEKYAPTHVFIEEPFAGGKDAHVEHWLHGMFSVVELICWRLKVPFHPVSNIDIKKYATGNGRAKKPLVMARVNEARPGRAITNHNIADAVALLDLVREVNRLGEDSFQLIG